MIRIIIFKSYTPTQKLDIILINIQKSQNSIHSQISIQRLNKYFRNPPPPHSVKYFLSVLGAGVKKF